MSAFLSKLSNAMQCRLVKLLHTELHYLVWTLTRVLQELQTWCSLWGSQNNFWNWISYYCPHPPLWFPCAGILVRLSGVAETSKNCVFVKRIRDKERERVWLNILRMKKSSSAQGVTPGDVSIDFYNHPSVQPWIHLCIHYRATYGFFSLKFCISPRKFTAQFCSLHSYCKFL